MTTTARPARRGRRGGHAWVFLAVPLAFYLTFVIVPWLTSVWYSLFEWDGIGASTWVGLANYLNVILDDEQLGSILHALALIVFFSVIPIVLGLFIAGVISRDGRHKWTIARVVIFLPQVLPLVAVGVAWKWVYASDGLLNQTLTFFGLGGITRAWLGDFTWAFLAVAIVGSWVSTGLCVVLFLSAIQRTDPALVEAVRLDGGGPVREFTTAVLPSIVPEIRVAATITVIAALASFDIVYVMTSGGPGTATMVPGVEIYRLAFSYNRVGEAAALSVVLSLLIYLVVLAINTLLRSRDR